MVVAPASMAAVDGGGGGGDLAGRAASLSPTCCGGASSGSCSSGGWMAMVHARLRFLTSGLGMRPGEGGRLGCRCDAIVSRRV